MIPKDAMDFRCIFAKEFDLDSVVVPISDLDTVIRVFIVGQDSPP